MSRHAGTRNRLSPKPRHHAVLLIALGAWAGMPPAQAATGTDASDAVAALPAVEFNRSLLMGGAANSLDLQQFEFGNPVQPGAYRPDVFLNTQWLGRVEIETMRPSVTRIGQGVSAFGPASANIFASTPQNACR